MPSAILTYHSIDSSGSIISVAPTLFQAHMEVLAGSRIPVVPLAEIQRRDGCLAITFDDGFENFESAALPFLEKYAFPATVFLVTRALRWLQ